MRRTRPRDPPPLPWVNPDQCVHPSPVALLKFMAGMAVAGAILAPYGLYVFFKLRWLDNNIYFVVACFASLILTALTSAVAYRACVSSATKLLAGLPV